MPFDAMSLSSDSQNPPRLFTLTPLGFEACKWIEEQDRLNALPMDQYPQIEIGQSAADDEFAFTCEHCHKPLSQCECQQTYIDINEPL